MQTRALQVSSLMRLKEWRFNQAPRAGGALAIVQLIRYCSSLMKAFFVCFFGSMAKGHSQSAGQQ